MPHSTDRVTEITSLDDPRVAPFASLTEAQLRNRLDAESAIFIAESPKVIRVALRAGLQPLSLLCESKHLTGDAADIIAANPAMEVLTGSRELLQKLTGYTLTRGVLCAMRRPAPSLPQEICRDARRVAVIDGVTDTTNIGAIFRSAAALGMEAVLLTATSCDPLNRRAVRVSMGTVFQVPWAYLQTPSERVGRGDYIDELHRLGFTTCAMALRHDNVSIGDPRLRATPRLAVILGTEGEGLAPAVIDRSDYVACIPMAHGVDSLNVAAASAVGFYALGVGN